MSFIRRFYCGIVDTGNFLQTFLLFAIRLYWGWSFYQAGWGKVNNIKPVIEYFGSLGIPYPEFLAPFVGWVECIGGLCLLFGFASRLVSIPLAINMIVALFTAHLTATLGMYNNPQRFINQLPFNYLLTSLIVFCFGPGLISVDYILGKLFCRSKRS
ncbi:MAG: putative oxidoreductase CatD [Chlamydiae bacterium]|nr:putative oxidoreductase CatD [Chlamydiota bacterium]